MKFFKAFLCCFLIPVLLAAQASEETQVVTDPELDVSSEQIQQPSTYVYPKVSMRPVSSDAWQKAAGNLNYNDDVPKVVEKKEAPRQRNLPNLNWNAGWWMLVAKIFSVIVLVFLVGLVIYQMVQSPSNQAIRAHDGTPITFDNLDAYIQETDLERFLREALATGNYNQAVRIYYLQVIKDLSQKEAIQWSREKTNRDYLREMRSHSLSSDFKSATHTYEEVWYGNLNLDQNLFSNIEKRMKELLQKLR